MAGRVKKKRVQLDKFPKKEGLVWDRAEKVFRKSVKGEKGHGFEAWLKDQVANKNTTFRTQGEIFDKAGAKVHGSNQRILDKYINQFTITSGSRLGGDVAAKNIAVKDFFDLQEPGSRLNIDEAVRDINKTLPKGERISAEGLRTKIKNPKLNTTFLGAQTFDEFAGQLTQEMKDNIIAKFGDQFDITMDSFNKNKYGISAGGRGESKANYEVIRRAVLDKDTPWNKAYNVGAADGWILDSMDRAGFKPLKDMIRGRERIIGYIDNDGTKWVGGQNWVSKHGAKRVTDSHPGWDRVNKLVNIVKETRVAPSKAIADLLAKGGVKNIDGLTLERLTGYLLNNDVDIKNIKKGLSTFHKHHVKGVKGSYADDIQLVTNVANKEARSAVAEIETLKKKGLPISDEVYDRIDTKLKNYDVTIDIDGKRLGSTSTGFESKADIEKFVTKNIKNWKTDDFQKFAKQFIKNDVKFASFPANIGAMWKTLGSGARKTLGWGTAGLTELVFMGLDMKNELSKGKSTEEAASIAKRNATFGVYKDDAYLKELIKVGDDMDIDTRAFEKVFALNEQGYETNEAFNRGTERIKALRELGEDKAADDLQKNLDAYMERQTAAQVEAIEGIAGQVSISKAGEVFPTPNLDQIAKSRYTLTSEEFEKTFTDVQKAGIEKLKREKTKAFDVQSKQVDPEAGSIGDPLIDFGFNLPAWHWKSILGVEEAPHLKERRHIKEMLEFSPQELYRYNLARGVDPDNPITQESFENLVYEQPGLGFSGAEGGIASLMKKKW